MDVYVLDRRAFRGCRGVAVKQIRREEKDEKKLPPRTLYSA